jgi:hypothetical protein
MVEIPIVIIHLAIPALHLFIVGHIAVVSSTPARIAGLNWFGRREKKGK